MRGFPGLVAGALLLSACQGQPADPAADAPWVRLPGVAGRPGAAYFTLTGGAQADTLLDVTSPAALKTELHETQRTPQGAMAMRPVRTVALPAGGTVRFAPGGLHVMLFDIGPAVKPGDKIPLVIGLASGKRIEVEAQVVGAGDSPPGG